MTKDKAIAELIRIWHSPHLDLSLKAGLSEAIETLKEKNQSDSLFRDDAENCEENESKLDLISRQDALCILKKKMIDRPLDSDRWVIRDIAVEIKSLPSADPKTGEWVKVIDEETPNVTKWHYECDQCGAGRWEKGQRYCQNCGARMRGEEE